MIRFGCPVCKSTLESREEDVGRKFPCPECGQRLQVPPSPPRANKTVLGEPLPSQNRTILGDPEPEIGLVPARPERNRFDYEDDDYDDYEDDFGYERRYRKARRESSAAGLVCSILSVVFGGIAFLCFPPLFGLAGLVLGIIGTALSDNKAVGIIGIVLSILGAICGMILGAMVAGLL